MKQQIKKWLYSILQYTLFNNTEINSFIINYLHDNNGFNYLQNIYKSNKKKKEFQINLINSINKIKKIDNKINKDYYIRFK